MAKRCVPSFLGNLRIYIIELDKYFNYYLIQTFTHIHNMILICAYPHQILNSNDCIYACLVNINQLLGDAVLLILLVIPRY